MELKNGEIVPDDAKSIIDILDEAKSKIKEKLKDLNDLDVLKLKEYIKRQKKGVKYYKRTSFIPKEYIESVEGKLITKLEKDYIIKEDGKEDIDENVYEVSEYIDESYPKWFKNVIKEIKLLQIDEIDEIWISKTKVDILGNLSYWILFIGNRRELDFKNEDDLEIVQKFKEKINFNKIENDLDILVCSNVFANDYYEEYGKEAFDKVVEIDESSHIKRLSIK